LASLYEDVYGVDVRDLPGSGAAGGLAGGLAAIGADLVPGFELVADTIDLASRVESADLVVTGEGFLDDQSFEGKAVGGVLELATEFEVPALVVAGQIVDGLPPFEGDVTVVSLVDVFGEERARADTAACVEDVVRRHLEGLGQ
jgi:glycerate kinase